MAPKQKQSKTKVKATVGVKKDQDTRISVEAQKALSGEPMTTVSLTPYCSGGFDVNNVDVGSLCEIGKLIGIDGGVILDTRVLAHADYDTSHPYTEETLVIIGVRGVPITLADVERALLYIPRDAWQTGRSYYWEGVALSRDMRRYYSAVGQRPCGAAEYCILWGS
jgi:hypothetical protein